MAALELGFVRSVARRHLASTVTRRALARLLVVGALALATAVGVPAAAGAYTQTSIGGVGEGAGQFDIPSGVAVSQANNDLYVGEFDGRRVDALDGSGGFLKAWGWGVLTGAQQAQSCTTVCFGGFAGAGSAELDRVEGVAVNNDLLSSSYGDVYVVDSANHRVQKFGPNGEFILMFGGEVNQTEDAEAGATEAQKNLCTAVSGNVCKAGTTGTGNGQFSAWASGGFIAVGADGTVYVGDSNRVQEFTPEGEYSTQVSLGASAGTTDALAVNAAGELYVASASLTGVRRYNATGTLIETLDGAGSPQAVALDNLGNVYVADGSGGSHVLEFSSTGGELASFGSNTFATAGEMAFDQSTGRLYVGDTSNAGVLWAFTPPTAGPLVEPGGERPSGLQPEGATLEASVNPEGAETTYRFEYGTSASYGSSTPQSASIGSGFGDARAEATVGGLQPGVTYHYRVVATSSAGTTFGPDQTFTTQPAVSIDSEFVANATASGATLQAQLNPHGAETTYRFEYGTSASYGASAPVPDGDIGSGMSDVAVSAHIQSLAAGTVYHYRVVASNALGTSDGPDQTFTTQLAGETLSLPDGRQWELVSPQNKHGALVMPIRSGVVQAAADGNAITYLTTSPTEENPAGASWWAQIVSVRGASGEWSSKDIATPHTTALGAGEATAEYRFFSPELSLSLVEPLGQSEPALSAKATERTIYIRNDAPISPGAAEQTLYEQAAGEALSPSQGYGYLPLVTPTDTTSGEKFSGVKFQGATPDLSHVVLYSPTPLVAGVSGEGMYEWANGQLEPVSVLPGAGKTLTSGGLGGWDGAIEDGYDARNAISSDGSRIVWTSSNKNLYLRDMESGESLQLDAAQGAPEPTSGESVYQFASSDGSKVFFTDGYRLTSDSTAGGNVSLGEKDLYECEIVEAAGKLTCRLSDLTVDAKADETASVLGVLPGGSEDGSYLYVIANGVLAPGASPGDCQEIPSNPVGLTCNLYVLHYSEGKWTTTYITTISEEDSKDWLGVLSGTIGDLETMTTRVSPNGRYLAFMSDRSLTGYDNRDANSGLPDEEVYLYDAATNRLTCASCNPSGARPVGVMSTFEAPVFGLGEAGETEQSLAAALPGWTPDGGNVSRYQSRYLLDNGRLFFDGYDAISPQATNGLSDVYEFEPQGVGDCTAGSVDYSSMSDGCVALISSGASSEESAFLDASENGDDVFFLTTAKLAPQDLDSAYDVYDAHVCSTQSPCAAVVSSSPPCSTTDSCRAAPSPQPLIFGSPPSATFAGAGNVTPEATQPVVKKASKTKPKKRAKKHDKRRKKRGKKAGKAGRRAAKGSRVAHRRASVKSLSTRTSPKSLSTRTSR